MPTSRMLSFLSSKMSEIECLPSATLAGVVSANSCKSAAKSVASIRSLLRCAN